MRFSSRTLRAAAFALSAAALAPVGGMLAASPAHAMAPGDSFADLAEKLLPAVVNISSSQSVQAKADRPGNVGCACLEFLRRILINRFLKGDVPDHMPPALPRRQEFQEMSLGV